MLYQINTKRFQRELAGHLWRRNEITVGAACFPALQVHAHGPDIEDFPTTLCTNHSLTFDFPGMFRLSILAESSSLDGLIHFVELIMSTTALPALLGFLILFWNRFRPTCARPAFLLGLTTVLLAGALCGWIWWEDAASEWYTVPGWCLPAGLLVCALAWYSHRRRPPSRNDGQ